MPRLPNLSADPYFIFVVLFPFCLCTFCPLAHLNDNWAELSWYDKRARTMKIETKTQTKSKWKWKPATENAINLMRQIVASAFGEQSIKLYEFLTYGIIWYMYMYVYIVWYVVLSWHLRQMSARKWRNIFVFIFRSCWFTGIFAEPNEWCECVSVRGRHIYFPLNECVENLGEGRVVDLAPRQHW